LGTIQRQVDGSYMQKPNPLINRTASALRALAAGYPARWATLE
jgi:hypothetical protein